MTALFNDKLIQNWIDARIKVHVPTVIIVSIFRLIFALLFVTFDDMYTHLQDLKLMENQNQTALLDTCRSQYYRDSIIAPIYFSVEYSIIVYAVLMLVICIVALGFILLEIASNTRGKITHSHHRFYPHREKVFYLYYWFYFLSEVNMFLANTVFISIRLARLYLDIGLPTIIDDMLFLDVYYNLIIFLVQVTQLLPKVGTFPIMMLRMLGDLTSFAIFLFLYMFPFGANIHRILSRGKAVCTPGFENNHQTFYSMFLIMMNMVDTRELSSTLDSSVDVFSLYLTHLLFIFLGTLLMLNLLIALFSQSVAKIMEHKKVIINLQRLYIVMTCEWKLSPILGWLFRIMRRRCYKYDNGKLFISSGSVKNCFGKRKH